ncbi:MAG: hypothetical protein ABI612_26220 [Betaproteobacteria bacterium]
MKVIVFGTLVTDLLLASFTLWLGWGLYQEARRLKDRAIALWLGAFCASGVSVVLNGLWHAFSEQQQEADWVSSLLWSSATVLAVTSSLLFLLAIVRVYTGGRVRAIIGGVAVAKFALLGLWIALNNRFGLIIYDTVLTMLIILVLSTWGAWIRATPFAPWVLAGVMISMLATLFQQGRVAMHPRFDHNDLYHVTQMLAIYYLYRGGMLLRDSEPEVPEFETTQQLPVVGEE